MNPSAQRKPKKMPATVSIQIVQARKLAAVRRQVAIEAMGAAWRPALDQVWKFLSSQPGLRTDGHNIFLYHHPTERDAPMNVDFGVEVTRAFHRSGEVHPTETPAGEVAMAVHIGGYDRLRETHDAIHAWAAAQQRVFAGRSWEIYGDWSDDHPSLKRLLCTCWADCTPQREIIGLLRAG